MITVEKIKEKIQQLEHARHLLARTQREVEQLVRDVDYLERGYLMHHGWTVVIGLDSNNEYWTRRQTRATSRRMALEIQMKEDADREEPRT